MIIRRAIPGLFAIPYPILEPSTEMVAALSLLRFHSVDAIPLPPRNHGRRQLGIFGFSCLARVLSLDRRGFGGFLREPCESAAEPMNVVRPSRSLDSLLQLFADTKFAFAMVRRPGELGALVGLQDILPLFKTGILTSSLTVDDVGSPIASIPKGTTVRSALGVMFQKRFRRLFVSGDREFVSERSIIGHLFSPRSLESLYRAERDPLDIPVREIQRIEAKRIPADKTVAEAAAALVSGGPGVCLVSEGRSGTVVVTPWDVVIKPWERGELEIG